MRQPKARLYFVLLPCLIRSVHCQVSGTALLTLSNNPVYAGEPVKFTCSYGDGMLLVGASIDAFDGANLQSSLNCSVPSRTTSGVGIFNGTNFEGCPSYPARSKTFNLTMSASPSVELVFSCTARVMDDYHAIIILKSSATSLVVNIMPEVPKFMPSNLTYSENTTAVILCESRNGRPAAAIRLKVTSLNGTQELSSGNDLALLTLRAPLTDWHNASAVCVVVNHNFSTMTTASIVKIKHIFRSGSPTTVYTSGCNPVLDCSAYVSSFPSASYRWSTPSSMGVTQAKLLNSPVFTVFQGQSGWFNCTATNSLTMKAVVVEFMVVNTLHSTGDSSACDKCWIAVVAVIIVTGTVAAVVLVVLFKRGTFSKRNSLPVSRESGQQGVPSTERSGTGTAQVLAERPQYELLRRPESDVHPYLPLQDEQPYMQLLTNMPPVSRESGQPGVPSTEKGNAGTAQVLAEMPEYELLRLPESGVQPYLQLHGEQPYMQLDI